MRHIFDCECIEHLLLIVFFARQLIIKQGRGDAITQQLILSAKKSGKTVIIWKVVFWAKRLLQQQLLGDGYL